MRNNARLLGLVAALVTTPAGAQIGPLPDIQRGTIAVVLTPVATNISAPCYAISPPGDLNRLFVVEQKGLLLVIQNDQGEVSLGLSAGEQVLAERLADKEPRTK